MAVWSPIAIANMLVDLNFVIQYGIAIRYVSKKFWWILIWQLLKQTAKPPNLIPCQIFQLYGITKRFHCVQGLIFRFMFLFRVERHSD